MKFLLIALVTVVVTSNQVYASNSGWENDCAKMLAAMASAETVDKDKKEDNKKPKDAKDTRIKAITEVRSLSELFANDGQFIKDHPTLVLNASQRLLSVINSFGVKEITDPETGYGKIKFYNLFSVGSEKTGYNRIVGHYKAIESVVANIEAAARGDTAGKYPPLLWGPPATGKTVFLTIPELAIQKAALENPEFHQFTFVWKNLDQVPSLNKLFTDLKGTAKDLEIKSPINESPFTLLPTDLQDAVLNNVASAISPKISGNYPAPKRQPNPQDMFILNEIIKDLGRKNGGKSPSSLEIVKALENHVNIIRHLPGEGGHRFVIPAQSKDVDVPGLFMSKSAYSAVLGSDHPFAYYLTGLFARSNGGILFIDEVGKNPTTLIAKFLNLIQDQIIQEGGAPAVPLDTVMITATNTTDIQKIRESDPQSPFLSRSKQIMMGYHTHPLLVAKTLAYELPNLKATPLNVENAKERNAKEVLDSVLPEVQFGQKVETADGRYKLTLGSGQNKVTFGPHALMYISYVAALTRMSFDFNEAASQKWPQVPVFSTLMRDPMMRIKAFMGETNVQSSVAIEYFKLSKALGEGTFGFDHRDVTKWLNAAVAEAQKQDNGNTVTPLLLKRTLESFLANATQKSGDSSISQEDKIRTLNFAEMVASQIIIPKMRADILSAISKSHDSAANEIYDSVVQSIMVLSTDPLAKEYIDERTNTKSLINKTQLEEISEIYKSQQGGRSLSVQEIASWHNHLIFSQRGQSSEKQADESNQKIFEKTNPGLMSAIETYQAKKVAQAYATTVKKFASIANGSVQGTPEETQRASELISKLKAIGYDEVSLKEALQLIAEDPSETVKP